jgi:hypothetical protein
VVSGTPSCAIAGHSESAGTYTGAITCATTGLAAANYSLAPGNAADLTINQARQTVTFTSTPLAHPVVGDRYPVAASASSGLPVSFSIDSSSASRACSLSGSTVSLIGVGRCVIDADQAGNNDYAPAREVKQRLVRAALPRNLFTVTHIQAEPDGTVAFDVNVPGPGTIDVVETASERDEAHAARALPQPDPHRFAFARAEGSTTSGGTIHFKVAPNARGQRLVRSHRGGVLRIRLWVAYQPTGGSPRHAVFYGLRIPSRT